MAAMNKMMEKLMDKPAQHNWHACQCIMLDRINVVKTSSFGHLPQPPPQCKKRPRPAEGPPLAPITKAVKTQHDDDMVDVEVEEVEDTEAASSEEKKFKEAEKKAKEAKEAKETKEAKEAEKEIMVKEKEMDGGVLMQDDPKVLEMNLVKY